MNWQYLIIHHTGAEEKDTEQIRRYHKSLGWRDIGYNFVIERNGLVVPGRSLDQPGAHCRAGGMNTKGIGIALIGNLEEHLPMPEKVQALYGLLGRLMRQCQIPVANVLGHREVPGAATACPGRYFPLVDVQEKLRVRLNLTKPKVTPASKQTSPAAVSPGESAGKESAGPDKPLNGANHDYVQEETDSGMWLIQVGAFFTREQAEKYALELKAKSIQSFVCKG